MIFKLFSLFMFLFGGQQTLGYKNSYGVLDTSSQLSIIELNTFIEQENDTIYIDFNIDGETFYQKEIQLYKNNRDYFSYLRNLTPFYDNFPILDISYKKGEGLKDSFNFNLYGELFNGEWKLNKLETIDPLNTLTNNYNVFKSAQGVVDTTRMIYEEILGYNYSYQFYDFSYSTIGINTNNQISQLNKELDQDFNIIITLNDIVSLYENAGFIAEQRNEAANNGRLEGIDEGKSEVINNPNSYDLYSQLQYQQNYDRGYQDGRLNNTPVGLEWVKSAINVFMGFLDFMILPGVTLGNIFSGLIILLILKWVLSWFRG